MQTTTTSPRHGTRDSIASAFLLVAAIIVLIASADALAVLIAAVMIASLVWGLIREIQHRVRNRAELAPVTSSPLGPARRESDSAATVAAWSQRRVALHADAVVEPGDSVAEYIAHRPRRSGADGARNPGQSGARRGAALRRRPSGAEPTSGGHGCHRCPTAVARRLGFRAISIPPRGGAQRGPIGLRCITHIGRKYCCAQHTRLDSLLFCRRWSAGPVGLAKKVDPRGRQRRPGRQRRSRRPRWPCRDRQHAGQPRPGGSGGLLLGLNGKGGS